MKIYKRSVVCLFGLLQVALVAALLVTPIVQSATLPHPKLQAPLDFSTTLATLVDQADLIARAQVVQTQSRWNLSHTLIETEHKLAVRYMFVGKWAPHLTVHTDGGFLPEEGLGLRTSHTASFALGEEVLIFLQEVATGYRVVGGEAGKFTVVNGKAISAYSHESLTLTQMVTVILDTTESRGRSATLPADWRADEPTSSPQLIDTDQQLVADPKWPSAAPKIRVKVNVNSSHIGDQGGNAEQFLAAITNALRTWSVVPEAEFTLLYDGETNSTSTGLNNKSEILFAAKGVNSQLGQAQIWFTTSGAIVEADIWINDDYLLDATGNPETREIDLESIILHELGHWLPLGHMINANAVMYAVLGTGIRKTILSSDDTAGITALYPCPAVPCIDPAYTSDATITPTATMTESVTATTTPTPTLVPSAVTPTPQAGVFLPLVTR